MEDVYWGAILGYKNKHYLSDQRDAIFMIIEREPVNLKCRMAGYIVCSIT